MEKEPIENLGIIKAENNNKEYEKELSGIRQSFFEYFNIPDDPNRLPQSDRSFDLHIGKDISGILNQPTEWKNVNQNPVKIFRRFYPTPHAIIARELCPLKNEDDSVKGLRMKFGYDVLSADEYGMHGNRASESISFNSINKKIFAEYELLDIVQGYPTYQLFDNKQIVPKLFREIFNLKNPCFELKIDKSVDLGKHYYESLQLSSTIENNQDSLNFLMASKISHLLTESIEQEIIEKSEEILSGKFESEQDLDDLTYFNEKVETIINKSLSDYIDENRIGDINRLETYINNSKIEVNFSHLVKSDSDKIRVVDESYQTEIKDEKLNKIIENRVKITKLKIKKAVKPWTGSDKPIEINLLKSQQFSFRLPIIWPRALYNKFIMIKEDDNILNKLRKNIPKIKASNGPVDMEKVMKAYSQKKKKI